MVLLSVNTKMQKYAYFLIFVKTIFKNKKPVKIIYGLHIHVRDYRNIDKNRKFTYLVVKKGTIKN